MDTYNNSERSAVQLLQEINSGILDPKLLDKTARQNCVELLIMEGYSHSQIAQILKCSEKTVSRDLKEIRIRNQMLPNVEFVKEFVGDLYRKAINHHSYLMRLARSKEVSPAEKIQSEYAAWKILKELVEKLQTLGYLPLKPQEITGELTYRFSNEDEINAIKEAKNMLLEIETTAKETDTFTPELAEELKRLFLCIEKAEAIEKIKEIKEKQEKQITHKEAENEE